LGSEIGDAQASQYAVGCPKWGNRRTFPWRRGRGDFLAIQCVADPVHFDQDPAFHFDTDSYPTFHFDTDPNPYWCKEVMYLKRYFLNILT
jgi:hypothetical protein